MRNLIVLFSILTCANFALSQNTRIIYDFTPNFEAELLIMPSLAEVDEVFRFSLLIDGQKTKFALDSIMIKSYPPKQRNFLPAQEVYTDFKESKWVYCNGKFKEGYCLANNLEDQINSTTTWKWEITDEKLNIAGLMCTKAIWLQNVAWFTEEIPLAIAPGIKMFCLPGAVLKYENPTGIYEAIKIENVTNTIIIPNKTLTDDENIITKNIFDLRNDNSPNIYLVTNETIFNKWIPIRLY
ncbi:MAG TPA: GLPGLI family protein [Saprospiraceae bacterium]|nr:GLPGLI family protein [Saprospiraceae bacterium]HPN68108.1 GLPGLI family protein [Saprospiraceae bacterium]